MWMSKTFVVVLTIFSFSVLADDKPVDHGGGAANSEQASTGNRAIAPDQVRSKDVDLVADLFPNLGKPFALSVFTNGVRMNETDYLPWSKALERAKASPADETDTSATMAVLFATINEKQRDKIVADVKTAMDVETKKAVDDKGSRDEARLDLLKRLFWAGKAIQGELSQKSEAQEFLKKFMGEKFDFKTGDFKTMQDQNGSILTKIDEAKGGDTAAKKFLRDNLNRDAILPYAAHQLTAGNKEFATKLVDAVSWKQDGATGPKFIDMVGPGNEAQRLFIGEGPKAVENAITAFSKRPGGFTANALAQTKFDKVAKEWYADDKGNLKAGVPAGATSASAAPEALASKPRGGAGATGSVATNDKGLGTNEKFDAVKVASDMKAKCISCHSIETSGDTADTFKVKASLGKGVPLNLAAVSEAVKRPSMSGNTKADEVKQSISAWLAQK